MHLFTRAHSELIVVNSESAYHLPVNVHETRLLSHLMSSGF